MSKKTPNLKVITPSKFEASSVRQHLNSVVNTMFSIPENPVIAYAIVGFHKNNAYTASYHCTDSGIHQVDLPDLVKNRLLETVINNTK